MEEEALFGDFDDTPPPPAKRSRPATAAAPTGSEARGGCSLPRAFAHLQHEAVVSISFRGMADEERLRLEEVLRECVVVPRKSGRPPSTDDDTIGTPQIAAADTVHYFQAYAADYAGASGPEAAVAAPCPQYERLLPTPLPLPPKPSAEVSGGSIRASGSGGRGGGRGGGRRQSGIGFGGRYFDPVPSSFTPGVLSAELRELLGMREGEPPPYLFRMQQMGYPPGYMHDPEAARADEAPLILHEHSATAAPAAPADAPQSRLVPMVDLPGLNAPPPPGSDPWAWGWGRR